MEAIDLILPAHNESETIGGTLREFYETIARDGTIPIRFIVCEDGSTDNTVEVVQKLSQEIPIFMISEPIRKGYSRAVIDGLRASDSSLVGFIDSDGQCDPRDFFRIYEILKKTDCDMVMGFRSPRRDHWIRLVMSSLFKLAYGLYFRSSLRDPSCP
jgi:glycosyltransferase involved in cell wall biosynthesis